ncbi:hypothetical protein CU044_1797 [Streptomyces sp. L-9-10]|nr:hypothetical protein CU044_1797 [Streptomyces sp. L-9-10]
MSLGALVLEALGPRSPASLPPFVARTAHRGGREGQLAMACI